MDASSVRAQALRTASLCLDLAQGLMEMEEGAKKPADNGKARRGRDFSPLEEQIIAALRGQGWLTTQELADAMGVALDNDLRVIVRNLSRRDYVETNQRLGVRLAIDPAPQEAHGTAER